MARDVDPVTLDLLTPSPFKKTVICRPLALAGTIGNVP